MEPPKKKLKATEINDVLEPSLVNKQSAIRYKKEYAAALPYPHLSFPKFANEELFAPRPSAVELRICMFVDTTFSIVPVNSLSTITLSPIEINSPKFINIILKTRKKHI